MALLKKIYSDLQFGFKKLSSGDLAMKYDEAAVNQSLKSLFNTRKGERVFNPNYGSNVPYLLFEPMDEVTAQAILSEIKMAIQTWEGARIDLTELKINIDMNNSAYIVDGTYIIKNTLDTGNFTIKLTQ